MRDYIFFLINLIVIYFSIGALLGKHCLLKDKINKLESKLRQYESKV